MRPMSTSSHRFVASLLAAGGLLFAAGCSGTQSPKLSVLGGSVKQRTEHAAVIDFMIDADNPNSEALPLQDVTYTVTKNGQTLFSGTRSAEAIIRRYGRQQFLLPASFELPAGATLEGEYEVSGSLVYIAPGALAETLFDQQLVKPSVSFEGRATVK